MLSEHSDRICCFFAADFEPQIGFVRKLSEVAERAKESLKWPDWTVSAHRIVLANRKDRVLMTVDHRRMSWQTLGLVVWRDQLDEHIEVTKVALQLVGVEKLKRLGFKTLAFLPMGMSHAELHDLLYDSFYVSIAELADILGKPYDGAVRLFGEKDGLRFELNLTPMKQSEASTAFFRTVPNLEKFVENPFIDPTIKDFHDRIASGDCLCYDMDVFQEDRTLSDLATFTKDALKLAESTCVASVARLKSLPRARGR